MQINISGANFNSDDVIAYTEVQKKLPTEYIESDFGMGGYCYSPIQTNLKVILKSGGRLVIRNFSAHDYKLLVDNEYAEEYKRIEKERIKVRKKEEILLNLESNLKKEKSYREDKEIFDMRYRREHPILSLFPFFGGFDYSEEFEKLLEDYKTQKLVELDKE